MLIQWYLIYFIVWFYGDCFQSWFTFSTCKLLFAPGDRWKALSEEEKDKYRNLSRADFEKARKQCLDASVPLRPSQLQQSGSTTSEVETSSPEVPTEDMVYLGNVHRIVDHAHGKGSYGTVYKVLHTPSFRFLAAKVETVGTSLKHEIQMLSPLSHPNLLPVLQSNFVPNGLSWFIMPFVETSLYTLLQKQALTINSQLGLALQLVDALSYLHSNNIVHCDIKPGNILCDMSTCNFFIIDFGLAVLWPMPTTSKRRCDEAYTMAFRPPELIETQNFTSCAFLCVETGPKDSRRLNENVDMIRKFLQAGLQ